MIVNFEAAKETKDKGCDQIGLQFGSFLRLCGIISTALGSCAQRTSRRERKLTVSGEFAKTYWVETYPIELLSYVRSLMLVANPTANQTKH